MALLEVKQLTKHFGGLTAVGDVTLELNEGELVGLIGPNGAGKTTLFNLLTGVYEPSEGTVTLDGHLLNGKQPYKIAAESVGVNTTKIKIIAFVFGAMTASIAGSLQAGFIGSVVPKDYSFINSINVLIIVVFGGLGSITGAIVAAIVLGILNMFLQDVASVRMIIYALALVLVMIFRPGGLLGTWELSLSRLFKKGKKEGQN